MVPRIEIFNEIFGRWTWVWPVVVRSFPGVIAQMCYKFEVQLGIMYLAVA